MGTDWFAFSPTGFEIRLCNTDDKIRLGMRALAFGVCLPFIVAPRYFTHAARPHAVSVVFSLFALVFVLQMLAVFRRLRRAPFWFELFVDADGVRTKRYEKPLAQCRWDEVGGAIREEEFNNFGQRQRADFVFRDKEGHLLLSVPVLLLGKDDAHIFQSVVARYLKLTGAL